NLTDFKIDCFYKKNNQWQKLGGYYPDFLIIQRNKQKQIHKVLILETKGEGYARAFTEKKYFMENDFIPLNNQKFGYNKFEFLYIQDDDKGKEQKLNQKIKAFFDSSLRSE
ncbi:MAG: restriction endonuclease subunit R, partial [Bacteroidetes bacterium]